MTTETKVKTELTAEAAQRALSFLADLNGCEWIKGDGPAERDMRQRAKAIQELLFRALAGAEG